MNQHVDEFKKQALARTLMEVVNQAYSQGNKDRRNILWGETETKFRSLIDKALREQLVNAALAPELVNACKEALLVLQSLPDWEEIEDVVGYSDEGEDSEPLTVKAATMLMTVLDKVEGKETPKHCLCDESKEVHYHCEKCDCILTGHETKLCRSCED